MVTTIKPVYEQDYSVPGCTCTMCRELRGEQTAENLAPPLNNPFPMPEIKPPVPPLGTPVKYPSAGYIRDSLNPKTAKEFVAAAVKRLRAWGKSFEAVAFTGLSGGIIAPGVAFALDLPIIAVRKGESSHSNKAVESGIDRSCRYVIVDDFIGSGNTVERIAREIDTAMPGSQCVAIVQYTHELDRDREWPYNRSSAPLLKNAVVLE